MAGKMCWDVGVLGEDENVKCWCHYPNSLRNRGVEDIFIACADNLAGFAAAVEAVFPKTEIQKSAIPPGMCPTST